MVIVYGIKNCDTVQRALKRLQDAGIEHRFHDFRVDGLGRERAQSWIATLGIDTVLNRRGTTWRKLDAASQARADGDGAAELLASQPSLVKRPVFEHKGALRVGFAKGDEAAILAWLR